LPLINIGPELAGLDVLDEIGTADDCTIGIGGGGVIERTALSKAWRLTMALLAALWMAAYASSLACCKSCQLRERIASKSFCVQGIVVVVVVV